MTPSTAFLGRYHNTVRQFVKFGLIGGSGVLVNLAVLALLKNFYFHVLHQDKYHPVIPIAGTDRAIRNYIIWAVVAFLVANLFNFVLNRHWTFRYGERAPFLKELWPFMLVGSVAAIAGIVLLQLMMNRSSPLYLSHPFFTDIEPFWRQRLYWAQLIQIVCVMPINFVVNKLWTFRAVRRQHAATVGS